MANEDSNKNEWMTLRDAGKLVGKTSDAIRMWIQRKVKKNADIRVKKERNEAGEYWVIHREEVAKMLDRASRDDILSKEEGYSSLELPSAMEKLQYREKREKMHEADSIGQWALKDLLSQRPKAGADLVDMISIEFYRQQRDNWAVERDELIKEITAYRFKLQELERYLSVLSVPVETAATELESIKEKIRILEQQLNDIKEQYEKEKAEKIDAEKKLGEVSGELINLKGSDVEIKAKCRMYEEKLRSYLEDVEKLKKDKEELNKKFNQERIELGNLLQQEQQARMDAQAALKSDKGSVWKLWKK